MNDTWLLIALLMVSTVALKMSGPFLVGHRELPSWTLPVITVMPGALLTALIVVQVVSGRGSEIVLDARLVGMAAAGAVLFWRRSALITAMVVAAVAAALARALF